MAGNPGNGGQTWESLVKLASLIVPILCLIIGWIANMVMVSNRDIGEVQVRQEASIQRIKSLEDDFKHRDRVIYGFFFEQVFQQIDGGGKDK